MRKSKTIKIGNIGEDLVCSLLTQMEYQILSRGKTSKYDIECVDTHSGNLLYIEVKTQPQYRKYNGFSIEIGNTWSGNYLSKPTHDFVFDNRKCVYTNIFVTESSLFVFTCGKHVVYFVSTESLKKWILDVRTNEPHRITWGGYDKRSLQIQLRIDELEKIKKLKIGEPPRRGRKPKRDSLK